MKSRMPFLAAGVLKLSFWALAPGVAFAQGASGEGTPNPSTPAALASQLPNLLPKAHYSRSAVFQLPVSMDNNLRDKIREICLYVKTANGGWVLHEVAPATIKNFSYKAPRDGEFSFSLVTIDKTGKATPANVNQEPPSLRVIVDTQAPTFDVLACPGQDGELCLKCKMIDDNPDLATIRAIVRTDLGDIPLQSIPGQSGVFRLPSKDFAGSVVRVTGSDLGGNPGAREINLQDLVSTALKTEGPGTPPAVSKVDTALAQPSKLEVPPDTVKTDVKQIPQLPNLPPPPNTLPSFNPDQVKTVTGVGNLPRQLVNTTHVNLEYRIDQIGPSGVSKVEIYLTTDNGQTWKRHAEDPQRRSPAEIDLPGDGVFGIRLAVTNGNGFGGTAPAKGDAPTCLIEVDTTPPSIQLRPIEPVAVNGCLEIRWTATDRNLAAEPVNLYFRTRADGPWQVMARNLKNDGLYRWAFPREAGTQFLVKLEVTDMAGNVARAETANPVALDMTEPRASVVGITGSRPVTPTGN